MAIELLKYLDKSLKYLHRQGAFLTVKDQDGKENVMTISWGGISFKWGRPIFTVLVRKSRYTHGLIENAKEFSVSIPTTPAARVMLAYTGTNSGRELDKFESGQIHKAEPRTIDVSTVQEGNIIYECRIAYKHTIDPAELSDDFRMVSYMDGDYHTIYYGEIVDCYQREDK